MTDRTTHRPADFGPYQMADRLGAYRGQIDRARELGLLPEPDVRGSRWSAALVEDIRGRWPQIAAAIEAARELGAARCASLLAERTGLQAELADIEELAARGLVTVSGSYKDRPLYRVASIEALASNPQHVSVLASIIAERQAWLATSQPGYQAAACLGWSVQEFGETIRGRGIQPGRFGRYAQADIDALAADEDLAGQIRGQRLIGPEQAAEHLEIRRTDFGYAIAAGWITPASYGESQISRRRTVDVPLYRVADVEALLEVPAVDWEAVRAARPGEPSPLREYAKLPTGRAVLVRGFAADLTEQYGTEVTASYDEDRDQWHLTWAPNPDGQPTKQTVRAALRHDRDLAPHALSISLHPAPAETAATDGTGPRT